MKIVPITQAGAKAFIMKHHRHNDPSITAVFCVGLEDENDNLIGVAMAGRPKARMADDGSTLEVTRVCVLEGHRNANSMLYGACTRAGKALGYKRMLTYTLPSETGASLKASGWIPNGDFVSATINGWYRPNLPRRASTRKPGDVDLFGNPTARVPTGAKIRWSRDL